ncbi:hypothetical protein [Gimesia aquarii]|uniref:Uncharacterized protein n=1 Tax=Gimesia aquarii TaxID=2527964 RepID=A0A517WX99_9PLAN|nr:hypothetical protein [Gimesia aquarii]QDU09822.1 hypothetical protein V202x_32190 [Gimesia aquarii]
MIDQIEDVEDRAAQLPLYASGSQNFQTASSKLYQYAEQKPMKSVLIGLGVGVGAGIILGSIFRGSAKYLSQNDALIERIGNNVKAALSEVAPSSLTKHFRS